MYRKIELFRRRRDYVYGKKKFVEEDRFIIANRMSQQPIRA